MTYYERFGLPPPGPADCLSMRPCLPTHGGIARLLVAWIRLPDVAVLASLPSRRVQADASAASSTGRAADS
jgi:hypothetical protein